MSILSFQKPDKVIMLESDNYKGIFEFRPLEPGYGLTIGNALRRVLLSSLEGFAFTSLKIEGVEQEFCAIPGVMEDVSDIVLNLKQVRLKQLTTNNSGEKIVVNINHKEVFKAEDLNKFMSNFQVLNPDLVICNLEPSVKLSMELAIEKGRGYVPAEENKSLNAPLGTIPIDSIFTPIKNVKYSIENYRVEQKTDYEKLIMEIITDGSISPKDALKESANILIHLFMLFSDEDIANANNLINDEFDDISSQIRQLLKTRLDDLDLSVRALNCLKSAEIATLGDLVVYNKNDLLKFRNFGKKSLAEIEELVKSKNLDFGMNVTKYKLDKD